MRGRVADGKRLVNPGAVFRTRVYTAATWDAAADVRFVDVPKS